MGVGVVVVEVEVAVAGAVGVAVAVVVGVGVAGAVGVAVAVVVGVAVGVGVVVAVAVVVGVAVGVGVKMIDSYAVQATPELARILAAPRRTYTPEQGAALAATFTAWLRRVEVPGLPRVLHAHQAIALHELREFGGVFGQILAGGGKTLIAFLAPVAVSAQRPLLLMPAALIEAKRREVRELAQGWHVATWARMISYEAISRDADKGTLERIAPDLIVCDEAHYLANVDAGVTRKVLRFLEAARARGAAPRLVAMSGTFTEKSILSYAHIADHTTPAAWIWLPRTNQERWDWHKALDKEEMGLGALERLGGPTLNAVRAGYRARMQSTPTVVVTTEAGVGASIEFREVRIAPRCPTIEAAFARLRESWELPDGWRLEDGPRIRDAALELSLGFFQAWEPRGPDAWLEARSTWAAVCRRILQGNKRGLDTEAEVKASVDAGHERQEAVDALGAWREIEPTFTPNSVTRWISRAALDDVAERLRHARSATIVWTHRTGFARELARTCGVPYFGEMGRDDAGRSIESHHGHCVASILANRTGRNLQRWHRSLVLMPAMPGRHLEQLAARTHREGQHADTVYVDLNISCAEHEIGLDNAKAGASYIEATLGQRMRLCYGTWLHDEHPKHGPRWTRTMPEKASDDEG